MKRDTYPLTRQVYKKDMKEVTSSRHRHLEEKVQFGIKLGQNRLRHERNRDFEENAEARRLAREEQEEIKKKKRGVCPKCGGYKGFAFTVCYHCNLKRKENSILKEEVPNQQEVKSETDKSPARKTQKAEIPL